MFSFRWCVNELLLYVQVGGDVRTNFSMPDVLSMALGGGTCVNVDPNNVSHKRDQILCGLQLTCSLITEGVPCY